MPKEISNLHKLPLVWKLPRWPSQHCSCRKWKMSFTGKLTSFILLNGKMWRAWGQSNMGRGHQTQWGWKSPVKSTGKSIKEKKPGVESLASPGWSYIICAYVHCKLQFTLEHADTLTAISNIWQFASKLDGPICMLGFRGELLLWESEWQVICQWDFCPCIASISALLYVLSVY